MRRIFHGRACTALAFMLGLLIATAGTATAAKLITGKQIKDGTISAKDLSNALRAQVKKSGTPGAPGPQGAVGPQGTLGPQGQKGDAGTTARFAELELADGAVNATILDFPGLGTLLGSCSAGVVTTGFRNAASGLIDVRQWGVVNGIADDTAVMQSTSPTPGGIASQSSAPQGLMGLSYLASYTGAGTSHVADIRLSSKNLLGTTCVVSASATFSG